MRGGPGGHTPPPDMQPCPDDNTSDLVYDQIAEWFVSGVMVHYESAREIAAWWQSPTNTFAPFASTGHVHHDLDENIRAELTSPVATFTEYSVLRALRALRAYVRACTVPVWTVGSNTAGYLPEGDVWAYTEYADAVSAYRDMVERAPNDLYGDVGECACVDGGEMCSYHGDEAMVASHLANDAPAVVLGRVFREPRELSIVIRPGHDPLPTVYWLSWSTRLYSELLAERS